MTMTASATPLEAGRLRGPSTPSETEKDSILPLDLSVEVLEGRAALHLLRSPTFRDAWDALFAACPWRTVFQRREFTSIWMDVYEDAFIPVVVVGHAAGGRLAGLLVLAAAKDRKRLYVAGTHHAEYQAWLSPADLGDAFAERAFDALGAAFPRAWMELRYLSSGAPMGWMESPKWRARTYVEWTPRALKDVGTADAEASMKKKGNKSRLRQLEREGEVRFERITDAAEYGRILDQFIPLNDFRQGAAHGVFPFETDAKKREFHERLFASSGLLYPTALTAGGRLVAAQIGFANEKTLVLGPHVFSPMHAKQSPGKLHVHMICERLTADAFDTLDMTPGPGWKERFATCTDHVAAVHVFFNRADRAALVAGRRRDRVAKRLALALGSSPDAVRARIAAVKSASPASVARGVVDAAKWVRSTRVADVLSIDVEKARAVVAESKLKVDDLSDLLAHRPRSAKERCAFLAAAEAHLSEGHHLYTHVEDGLLVAFGRLVGKPEKLAVPAVGADFELPANAVVLADFWTHPTRRRNGHFERCLRQALRDAAAVPGAKSVWVAADPRDAASARLLEKLGFRRRYRTAASRRWGRDLPLEVAAC